MTLAIVRRAGEAHQARRHALCEGCDGKGWILGADLGVVGMVGDDGEAIRIPCIVCDGVPAEEVAPPPQLRLIGK